jgi:hypothetical protein
MAAHTLSSHVATLTQPRVTLNWLQVVYIYRACVLYSVYYNVHKTLLPSPGNRFPAS